jgi:hypothetical protein
MDLFVAQDFAFSKNQLFYTTMKLWHESCIIVLPKNKATMKKVLLAAIIGLPLAGLMAQGVPVTPTPVEPTNPVTPPPPPGGSGGMTQENDRNLPAEIRAKNNADWISNNVGPLDPRAAQCLVAANESYFRNTRDAINNNASNPAQANNLITRARMTREQQLRSCLMPHQYDKLKSLRPAQGFSADGMPTGDPGPSGGPSVTVTPPSSGSGMTTTPSGRQVPARRPSRPNGRVQPTPVAPPAPVSPGAGVNAPNDRVEGETR